MESNQLIRVQAFHAGLPENVCDHIPQVAGFFSGNGPQLTLVWPFIHPDRSQNRINEEEIAAMVAGVKENERRLIGQELHDNVNQILSTVILFTEMLRPADARDMEIRQKAVEYARTAIEEIRKISRQLVMPGQREKGLVDNIRQIIDDIHLSTSIKIVFEYSGNIECLTSGKKVALLRIVQEQIKNVIKYSKASLVNIELHLSDGNTSLLIEDNGVGFDPKLCRQGIGLSNIYERAQSHNGVVDLRAAKGFGCSLTVCLPG